MKKCNKCLENRLLTEFFKDKATKDGHATICKNCKNKATQVWRETNRDKYNKASREYKKENALQMRLYRYRMNVEQYNKMLAEQKGCCAICEKPQKGIRPLAVDHNHKTGKVRALLCYGCNRALHVLESVDLLARAMAYLKKHE